MKKIQVEVLEYRITQNGNNISFDFMVLPQKDIFKNIEIVKQPEDKQTSTEIKKAIYTQLKKMLNSEQEHKALNHNNSLPHKFIVEVE